MGVYFSITNIQHYFTKSSFHRKKSLIRRKIN